jgi:hypothetical protein
MIVIYMTSKFRDAPTDPDFGNPENHSLIAFKKASTHHWVSETGIKSFILCLWPQQQKSIQVKAFSLKWHFWKINSDLCLKLITHCGCFYGVSNYCLNPFKLIEDSIGFWKELLRFCV